MRGAQHPSCKFGTPEIWETIRAKKLKFYTPSDGTIPLFGNEFFRQGTCAGRTDPSANLEPPHISDTVTARKLKFNKHLDGSGAPFGNIFFCKGCLRRVVPPSVNLARLISRFFVRWLLCIKLFLCFSFLHSFATFVVMVMGQGQMS